MVSHSVDVPYHIYYLCRKFELDNFHSGYGDDPNPYTETVEFLDDLVMEFITDMTQKSMEIGRSGRVQVEDIIFISSARDEHHSRSYF